MLYDVVMTSRRDVMSYDDAMMSHHHLTSHEFWSLSKYHLIHGVWAFHFVIIREFPCKFPQWPIMWRHVTSQYDLMTSCDVTYWILGRNYWNVWCSRCMNTRAFLFAFMESESNYPIGLPVRRKHHWPKGHIVRTFAWSPWQSSHQPRSELHNHCQLTFC